MRAGGPSDTIVAVATPPGTGAIGVIRLSGPRAMGIAGEVLRTQAGSTFSGFPPRTIQRVSVVEPITAAPLDEALAVSMPAPRSYTGEDVVEISCHGNPLLLQEILRLAASAGARLAEPGEFTRRAYLNGRMSLLEAEAVAELIAARSERAVRLAARELRGGLSDGLRALRESLLDVIAGLEVALDFPEDEVGVSEGEASEEARAMARRLRGFIVGARQGRVARDGLVITLAGAPNVGKSSLLNALLGADRAIVAPTPGTTRDVIEGRCLIKGIPIRLLDAAGLGSPRDDVDAEGMRRARQAIAESDLALVVLDRSRPAGPEDAEVLALSKASERLLVANKSDLPEASGSIPEGCDCLCSALTLEGIPQLLGRIEEWVGQRVGTDGDEGIMASLRVVEALGAAADALERAAEGVGRVPLEAVLVDLREAKQAVDEALGIHPDEAVLDRIFSSFCVGK